jgi:hypothetical protein
MILACLGLFLAPGLLSIFQKMLPLKTQNSISALKTEANYDSLPLSFEPNQGQTDASVKFLCRGNGYNLFLTNRESVLVLRHADKKVTKNFPKKLPMKRQSFRNEVVRLKLKGAQPPSAVEGLEKLPGISNYFIGNDPSKWHTDIPQYAKVQLKNIYPGIDVVYYGYQGKLEHDFVVSPGADPRAIHLVLEGVKESRVDPNGDLVLITKKSSLILKAPMVYQVIKGQKKIMTASYELQGRQLAFKVLSYDKNQPLVIDPVLDYSTYVGGGTGQSIAADASGNAYVTGVTGGGFPVSPGTYQTSFGGDFDDAFVIKLNPAGTALVYSTYLGGSGVDEGKGIAVDSSGNAYVTGYTTGNFPTTAGAYQTTLGGGAANAFVAKLNPTGSTLIYSTYLGGSADTVGLGIALDSLGNAYVTGYTAGNFPTTAGAYQSAYGGGFFDVFVTKLNAAGSALIYSTYLGGNGDDEGLSLAVDSSGNVYVAGSTTSTNFPTTLGAFQTVFGGIEDSFITKLNPTGTGLVYSTYLGGSLADIANGIAVDSIGNAYVTGETLSTNFPTTAGAYNTVNGGVADVFVTKLNTVGSALVYSTYLGGVGEANVGYGIAIDSFGNAYVTGYTTGNFPTTAGAFQINYGGGSTFKPGDAFVSELNSTGSVLVYSSYLGGSDQDYGYGIALDPTGDLYVTGFTHSTDFPTTGGAYQTNNGGADDVFVTKFDATVFGPTPTSNNTATNTSTNTPTNTSTSTITNTPTISSTPTNTTTITPTFTSTTTPSQTPTFTPTPTYTPTCVTYVWPDPFNPKTAVGNTLRISCMNAQTTVSIYTISGELVQTLDQNSACQVPNMWGMVYCWNGRNNKGYPVAAGIYIYVVGQNNQVTQRGKFLMLNGT